MSIYIYIVTKSKHFFWNVTLKAELTSNLLGTASSLQNIPSWSLLYTLLHGGILYLKIRLWARDFYEVIVDEAEGRISYRLIEIESE